jgi:CheY-like chemotaxis protein
LFVDDDVEVVMFASRVLRDAGFEVLAGGNGNVALSTAQVERLDLVITDLVMPDREGLETIMRLRKSHPALPVVAISGAFGGHFLKCASTLRLWVRAPRFRSRLVEKIWWRRCEWRWETDSATDYEPSNVPGPGFFAR